MTTRAEHLAWAKDRALEYAAQGNTAEAIASLTSDLGKHEETSRHPGIPAMTILAMNGEFDQPGRLREFIERFQ